MNKLLGYARIKIIGTDNFSWKNRKISYHIFDDGDDNPHPDEPALYDEKGEIYISSLVDGDLEVLRRPIAIHEDKEFSILRNGGTPSEVIVRDVNPSEYSRCPAYLNNFFNSLFSV